MNFGSDWRRHRFVVTGAGGFIGSYFVRELLKSGVEARNLFLVDDWDQALDRDCVKSFRDLVSRSGAAWPELPKLLDSKVKADWVLHWGAISSTDETDENKLKRHNLDFSKSLFESCATERRGFVYASSASTYGDGKLGFDDDPLKITQWKPLNLYGQSKHQFDLWATRQTKTPSRWVGLKFFNVYGPGERHKGSQASVVVHAKKQLEETGVMKLFRSQNPDFQDGRQQRDFVYVGDCLKVVKHFVESTAENGLFNCGTGRAQTWLDLVDAVRKALGMAKPLKDCVSFIDLPQRLASHYQYFTEAKLDRLRATGYDSPFESLDAGVSKSFADWECRL
jgi:ADP-L-glycero-D-manno-heptose 6-epimerase